MFLWVLLNIFPFYFTQLFHSQTYPLKITQKTNLIILGFFSGLPGFLRLLASAWGASFTYVLNTCRILYGEQKSFGKTGGNYLMKKQKQKKFLGRNANTGSNTCTALCCLIYLCRQSTRGT